MCRAQVAFWLCAQTYVCVCAQTLWWVESECEPVRKAHDPNATCAMFHAVFFSFFVGLATADERFGGAGAGGGV